MADVQVARINDHIAVAVDEFQYVVQAFRGVRKSGKRAGSEIWDARYFTRNKFTLLALLVRAGAKEFEAYLAVRDLPETIAEYHCREGAAKPRVCAPC